MQAAQFLSPGIWLEDIFRIKNKAEMPDAVPLAVMVVCLGGLTQGVTGFGFGLVAMPLLPLFMPLQQAVAVTALLSVVVCAVTLFSIRGHWSIRAGAALIVSACLGVPLGVFFLSHCSETVLLRSLGAVMVCFAVNELVLGRRRYRIASSWGVPLGILSGGLSGAFNMGGPPAVAFTYSQSWTKEQTVAVLQVVFGLTTIIRLLLLGANGMIDRSILRLALWAFVPLVVTLYAGSRLLSRVPQARLRQVTFAFIGVMGVKYLVF